MSALEAEAEAAAAAAGVGLFDDMADFSYSEYLNTNECNLGNKLHEMEAFASLTEVESVVIIQEN